MPTSLEPLVRSEGGKDACTRGLRHEARGVRAAVSTILHHSCDAGREQKMPPAWCASRTAPYVERSYLLQGSGRDSRAWVAEEWLHRAALLGRGELFRHEGRFGDAAVGREVCDRLGH